MRAIFFRLWRKKSIYFWLHFPLSSQLGNFWMFNKCTKLFSSAVDVSMSHQKSCSLLPFLSLKLLYGATITQHHQNRASLTHFSTVLMTPFWLQNSPFVLLYWPNNLPSEYVCWLFGSKFTFLWIHILNSWTNGPIFPESFELMIQFFYVKVGKCRGERQMKFDKFYMEGVTWMVAASECIVSKKKGNFVRTYGCHLPLDYVWDRGTKKLLLMMMMIMAIACLLFVLGFTHRVHKMTFLTLPSVHQNGPRSGFFPGSFHYKKLLRYIKAEKTNDKGQKVLIVVL